MLLAFKYGGLNTTTKKDGSEFHRAIFNLNDGTGNFFMVEEFASEKAAKVLRQLEKGKSYLVSLPLKQSASANQGGDGKQYANIRTSLDLRIGEVGDIFAYEKEYIMYRDDAPEEKDEVRNE